MTVYESLLWLHVSFAVVWAGGDILMTILGARASRGSGEERAYFASQAEWVGLRVFTPASLLTLIFGIWLAIDGDWDFGALWISASFTLFFASFVIGAGFLGPTTGKIARRVAEFGADDAQAQTMIDRVLVVARIDSFILLAIVYLMTTKPGA